MLWKGINLKLFYNSYCVGSLVHIDYKRCWTGRKDVSFLCIRQWKRLEIPTQVIRVRSETFYFQEAFSGKSAEAHLPSIVIAFHQEKKTVQIKGQICQFLLELSKYFKSTADHHFLNFRVTQKMILESICVIAPALEPRFFLDNEKKLL